FNAKFNNKPSVSFVFSLPFSIAFFVCLGKLSNSPIVSILTLFLIRSGKKVCKNSFGNFIKKSTSDLGLFQFSVEQAYKVKISTSCFEAVFTIFLTTSIPSLCPAALGNPRFLAQRPLPSIIIAICFGILSILISGDCSIFFFLKNGSLIGIFVLQREN